MPELDPVSVVPRALEGPDGEVFEDSTFVEDASDVVYVGEPGFDEVNSPDTVV